MKKKTIDPEELKKNRLISDLKDLRERYIPEPTILYKIGDRVQRGNIDCSIIEEVLDNGKLYLLNESGNTHYYGKDIPYENDKTYVSWVELVTYRSSEDNAKTPELFDKEDIRLSFSQRDISSIFCMAYHFGIDFNPPYQRDFCWEREDKVMLIDSVFNNVDIGKFVFIKRDYAFKGPLYEVLDGKQRIKALLDFHEGRFCYKGLRYRDLHYRDMNMFDRYPISVAVVDNNKEVTEEFKYKYFLKLNTTGKPQSEEHLAKVRKMYEESQKTK